MEATKIVSVTPEFGVNYDVGFIGFTYNDTNVLSRGVAWFTRWAKDEHNDIPDVPLSHVIVVTSKDTCVEAIPPKVKETPLEDYFNAPHTHVFFRKPAGWTPEIGQAIADVASTRIGCSYGYTLILGHLLSNSVLGKLLGKLTFGWSTRVFEKSLEKKRQFICSELAATALNALPEYDEVGVLATHAPHEIDPQMLFQDTELFEPWTKKVKGQKIQG